MTAGVLFFGLIPWTRLGLLLAARRPDPLPDVDARLLRQAQAGDARAFAEMVRHYEPRLRALAYRILEDRDLTDDALQEAFVRVFKSLGQFRGDSSFGTWIYRITYNACIDELRRGRRVVPLLGGNDSEPIDVRSGPENSAIERRDLAAAMASLPPTCGPRSCWSTSMAWTMRRPAACSACRLGRWVLGSTGPGPSCGWRWE